MSIIPTLQCINHIRDELRKLIERWNNRLILEVLSFVESYVPGRIAIALIVEIVPSARRGPLPSRCQSASNFDP
jgi:hypothetical protein